jgi:lambda repressor-like predicted transcriptional regulator
MSTVAETGSRLASELARYLQAFHDCSPEIQSLALEMAAIVADESSSDDERQLAADAMIQAIFPGEAADAFDSYKARLASPEAQAASEAISRQQSTFANNLRRIMAERKVTQEELARAAGVGQPAIANLLARKCRPQQRTIRRFADALGVSTGELWTELD